MYEEKLLEGTGAKEEAYKVKYKRLSCRVRLVDEKNNIQKLPKEYVEKLEKHGKHQQKKETEKIFISEVKKILNSDEIVEIISENKPGKLEKKKAELAKKRIEAELKPAYIRLGKRVVTVEWVLVWFEREGGDRYGRD